MTYIIVITVLFVLALVWLSVSRDEDKRDPYNSNEDQDYMGGE